MKTRFTLRGWQIRLGFTLAGLALLVPAVAALGRGQPSIPPALGAFHADCSASHVAPDDPIVFPGQAGASHLHEFFGNRQTRAATTARALRRQVGTTCVRDDEAKGAPGPADSSAYWVPAVYVGSKRVPAFNFGAYYSSGPRQFRKIKPFPRRLRMIAGDASGRAAQMIGPSQVYLWECGGRTRVPATRHSAPTCATRDLRLYVTFPDCWDGRRLDSADHKSHMFYSEWSAGEARCPASHPVPVPAISFSISWPVGDGRGARLASGPVRTMHGDVFSAWDPGMLASHVVRCLHAEDDCGSK
jgi:Domain of unknown function (DUF1996)